MNWFRRTKCEKSIEGHSYVYKEVIMKYSNAGSLGIVPEYYEVHRCNKCGSERRRYVGDNPR